MSLFDTLKLSRLKNGLTKTRNALVTKINRLVFAKGNVDEDFLHQLEEILIGADVGVETTHLILSAVKQQAREQRYENPDELNTLIRASISNIIVEGLAMKNIGPFDLRSDSKPYVIMVVGVNGVGKTTTIGKLAFNYKSAGKSVLIGAADTFRAAANEQLEIWAQRAGVTVIQQLQGSDPAAVAFDTVKAAQARNADVVIIDTAGRLHTKINLMEELKKIKRVINKCDTNAPHEVLLVLDASTGQNAIQQAKQFDAAVGLTGLVVTKLDGTAKGGIIIAITRALKIPVRFIGVGEQLEDLQPFDSNAFVEALFEKEAA
ncbi:MAG: signal recognition particle-docking protein FtsY [Bacteroidota bacterium]